MSVRSITQKRLPMSVRPTSPYRPTTPTIDGTQSVWDTLRTVTIAVRERHYPRDRLVLRVSRYVCSLVYAYGSYVFYTCLQSTSPSLYQRPYDLRLLRVPTSCPPFDYNVVRATALYYRLLMRVEIPHDRVFGTRNVAEIVVGYRLSKICRRQ